MKNQVIKTSTKSRENFGFTDTDIVISSKNHKEIDALIAAKDKSSIVESVLHIPMGDLQSLTYNEHSTNLKVNYNKKGKTKKVTLDFGDTELRSSIASSLGEINGFSLGSTSEAKWKPLLLSLAFIFAVVLITVGLAGTAYEMSLGGEMPEFSGRKSGMKTILVKIASALGPIGVSIIGTLGTGYLIFSAIKRWKNPASDVSLS